MTIRIETSHFQIVDIDDGDGVRRCGMIRLGVTIARLREDDTRALADALLTWLDAPRLAAREKADTDRAARGVTTIRAASPFNVHGIADQIASDLADEYDDSDWISDQIERGILANEAEIERRLDAEWDRIVEDFGLFAEVVATDDYRKPESPPAPVLDDGSGPRAMEPVATEAPLVIASGWTPPVVEVLADQIAAEPTVYDDDTLRALGLDPADVEMRTDRATERAKVQHWAKQDAAAPAGPRYVAAVMRDAPIGALVAPFIPGYDLTDAIGRLEHGDCFDWLRVTAEERAENPDDACIIDTQAPAIPSPPVVDDMAADPLSDEAVGGGEGEQ